MSGHTLTLVDDTKLCLIGGFSSADYFNELVYEYDASDNSWAELRATGSTPTGILVYFWELLHHKALYDRHSLLIRCIHVIYSDFIVKSRTEMKKCLLFIRSVWSFCRLPRG